MRLRGGSGRAVSLAGLAALAALALTACVPGGGNGGQNDADVSSNAAPTTTLTVYAAASLTDAFEELATRFEAVYPSIDVAPIVADASSVLATQIVEGAPADVFATADEVTMAAVADEGLLAASPQIFAQNAAVLAVPAGNPAGIADLAAVASPGVRFIVCAPEVPCGRAADDLLTAAGVDVTPVSEEQNVTAVLTKLQLGEADAGVVYRSDLVRADGTVEEIDTSSVPAVVNRYPIAPVGTAADPEAADAFVRFVLGAEGQAVLAEFGFSGP
ncbi:molybdate ABC transporter substrate-binding protein [Agromyces silvae]|uniref:molybdate ABC transporter substrate-binding protein n=1 Tax=Agromyces silvae TaxID=3388266 RepID=UPI00280A82A9|nr:molybdate ABC transporter substrate-binding protein [Agromyces protaetiae]